MTALLMAVFLCFSASAESLDLSSFSDDDLLILLKQVQAEVQLRFAEKYPSPVGDFIYASNGQEIRINAYTGSEANIVIPSEIDGLPVTQFQKGAFAGNKTIESVVLPDTITVIDEEVFKDCTGLVSVVFPKNLTVIKDQAFYNSLSGVINLPASLLEVGGVNFDNQSGGAITGLVINSDLQDSNRFGSAYMSLKNLKFLFIREGCNPTFIDDAFNKTKQLETVIIPASVTSLPKKMFADSNLVKIITPAGSYAESWAIEHFIPVDTENYTSYAEEYNALYPIP